MSALTTTPDVRWLAIDDLQWIEVRRPGAPSARETIWLCASEDEQAQGELRLGELSPRQSFVLVPLPAAVPRQFVIELRRRDGVTQRRCFSSAPTLRLQAEVTPDSLEPPRLVWQSTPWTSVFVEAGKFTSEGLQHIASKNFRNRGQARITSDRLDLHLELLVTPHDSAGNSGLTERLVVAPRPIRASVVFIHRRVAEGPGETICSPLGDAALRPGDEYLTVQIKHNGVGRLKSPTLYWQHAFGRCNSESIRLAWNGDGEVLLPMPNVQTRDLVRVEFDDPRPHVTQEVRDGDSVVASAEGYAAAEHRYYAFGSGCTAPTPCGRPSQQTVPPPPALAALRKFLVGISFPTLRRPRVGIVFRGSSPRLFSKYGVAGGCLKPSPY
ncbi:MAG: hypothetical protein QM775_24440 [Pirellulales bacterium]